MMPAPQTVKLLSTQSAIFASYLIHTFIVGFAIIAPKYFSSVATFNPHVPVTVVARPQKKSQDIPKPRPAKREIPPRPGDDARTRPTQKTIREESPKIEKVQGLPPDAVTNAASSFAAPIGNTLMVEDEGKRLDANQVKQLTKDLSNGAILIQGSFTIPEYTQAALDANLEGVYVVDVYVDEKGNVIEAQLRKKIGYGMDILVIASAQSARFKPRTNSMGGAIPGWTEIRFRLTIP